VTSARRRWCAGLALAALAAGCSGETLDGRRIQNERGAVDPTASRGATARPVTPAPGAVDPNATRRPPAPTPGARAAIPAAPGATAGAGAAAGGGDTADYSAALASAFGSPASCISASTRERLEGQSTLRVSVRVRATPSGRVTSATVTGGGLSDEDRACMTAHAEGLRLPAIEDGPRTVSASIEYDVQSTPGTRTDPETPEYRLPSGAQRPGVVLPAQGAEGRPAGAVTPDSTLPAQTDQGRPAGSVEPDIVLPAQGR